MSRFIKIVSLLLCVILSSAALFSCGATPDVESIKKSGKLVMLTNASFPPFEYIEGNTIVGVDVDIATEIAKDLGVELEIQDMEFASIVGAIKSGKGSIGAAGMSISEDRLKNVDFSVEYINSKLFILVREDETEIVDPDTLVGVTIGVQAGTTSDVFATDVENATISRYKTFLEAATALKTGKVNAVVVDELTAAEILAVNADLKQLETPLADEQYAICVQKGNTTLLDAINATLNRLLEEGKIEEFVYNHTAKDAAE